MASPTEMNFTYDGDVESVTVFGFGAAEIHLEVSDLGSFAAVLAGLARDHGISLFELSPSDESLESVFSYLVAR